MIGKRLPDIDLHEWHADADPGTYFKLLRDKADTTHQLWGIVAPNGNVGTISSQIHTITEHEDRSITVSPSILFREPGTWHGYLEKGVWRSC
jgi:hypothetical protein